MKPVSYLCFHGGAPGAHRRHAGIKTWSICLILAHCYLIWVIPTPFNPSNIAVFPNAGASGLCFKTQCADGCKIPPAFFYGTLGIFCLRQKTTNMSVTFPAFRRFAAHVARQEQQQIRAPHCCTLAGRHRLLHRKRILGIYRALPAPARALLWQRLPPLPLSQKEKGRIDQCSHLSMRTTALG